MGLDHAQDQKLDNIISSIDINWVGWDDVTTSMQFHETKCQQIISVTSFKNDNEPKNYVDEIIEI